MFDDSSLWVTSEPPLCLPLCSSTLLIAVPILSDPVLFRVCVCADDFWDLLVIFLLLSLLFPWLLNPITVFCVILLPILCREAFMHKICSLKVFSVFCLCWRLNLHFSHCPRFLMAFWGSAMIHNWANTKVLLEIKTYFTMFPVFYLSYHSSPVISILCCLISKVD